VEVGVVEEELTDVAHLSARFVVDHEELTAIGSRYDRARRR